MHVLHTVMMLMFVHMILEGFSIGSAALVSLALFGAFVSRAGVQTVDVLTPKVFIGIIVGAILPYGFLAMTMKSVGCAALKMVEEVRRQFNTIPGFMEGLMKPDYTTCVKISTDATGKFLVLHSTFNVRVG
ncbi:inorganic pyrophosphatase [Tanacetum coccineum]